MRIAQCEVHSAVGCASERAAMLTVTRRTRGPKDQGSCDNVERTIEMSWLTVESIGKMISGVLSPENLSGPLTIARVAGDSANSGWYAYLSFIAYLSVSLGVLNLLPIPVLDGGHLVFFAFEWLIGRPVPDKLQIQGIRVGMALLMGLMFFAFYNDLMRL